MMKEGTGMNAKMRKTGKTRRTRRKSCFFFVVIVLCVLLVFLMKGQLQGSFVDHLQHPGVPFFFQFLHTRFQCFWCIFWIHWTTFLYDFFPCVQAFVDNVDRHSGLRFFGSEDILMCMEPRILRKKRWMHIQDAVLPFLY